MDDSEGQGDVVEVIGSMRPVKDTVVGFCFVYLRSGRGLG